nr:ash family protein [Escherichia sp. E13S3]
MAGRAGASQDAPVSVRLVVPTPSGSATREIGTSGGGHDHHSLEVASWLQSSPLIMIYSPFLSVQPRISPIWPTTAIASPRL